MAKGGRRRPRTIQQIEIMGQAGLRSMDYPKSIAEAIDRGDRMVQAVSIRNARQTKMLTRASKLMEAAVDECTCGGIGRAIALVQKGEQDEAGAPDTEGD